jgi:dienelactone hydrolase
MKIAASFAAAVLLLMLPQPASADPVASLADGRTGRVEFSSMTPSGPTELVRRSYTASGTTVAGTLVVPPTADGRTPAMVIAHGSGGILPGREDAWAARLNALGIATFVVDSFTPRGLQSTSRDQSRLSTMANLADALAALRLLATHPRIDPARIGVMGFSRGGQVALYSALEPLRRGMIDGNLRFAAHVALYPSCSIPYRAEEVSAAPILMLLGGADDYTPAAACRDYAAWFASKGAPVEVIAYEGAYHDFDIPDPPRFLPALQSARGCRAEVEVDSGTVRRLDTGEGLRDPTAISAYFRACMQRGATIGGDPAALARAERDVAAFLRGAFNLQAR